MVVTLVENRKDELNSKLFMKKLNPKYHTNNMGSTDRRCGERVAFHDWMADHLGIASSVLILITLEVIPRGNNKLELP